MIIKKIVSKTIFQYRICRNYLEAKYLRKKQPRKLFNTSIKGKVLILVPHVDDEWVGNSCLFDNPDIVLELVNMDMRGGDSEKIHELRYKELKSVANNKSVVLINIRGDFNKKVICLNKLIKERKPDYISVPSFFDWHQEHLEVNNILAAALAKQGMDYEDLKILMYEVSVPMPISIVTDVYGMSKTELYKKWSYFTEMYKTQSFFPIKRYMYNEYINGSLCNSYAAECYLSRPYKEWIDFFDKYRLDESERIEIENNFMKLKKIRYIVGAFLENKSK